MNAFLSAPEGKKRLTLAALFCAILGSILMSSTQSTMLPLAANEIGGADYYTLTSTLQGIVAVVAMPLFGYVICKNPALKSRIFCVSMLVSAVVVLSRVFVGNMWAIIIPGMLYGFASASIYVVGYSFIRDIYGADKAAYYLGFVATMQSIAQIAGPLLGGVIMDSLSWRYMNHLIWPFFTAAGVLAILGVNVRKDDVKELCSDAVFDAVGAVSLALFLCCLSLALSLGSGTFAPFGSVQSTVLIVIAVVALVVLILDIKSKGNGAFLPLGVLKERNTLCLALASLFCNLHSMATYIFLPMYALYVLGVSATASGLITSCYAIVGIFMGPIWGKMIGKRGSAKQVYLIGTTIRVITSVLFVLLINENTSIFLIYALMLVCGFYNSQTGVTFAAAPQLMIREENRVMGNSVIQICQSVGATISVAVYTLIIGMFGVATGIQVCFAVALAFAVLALVCGLFMGAGKREEK